MSINATVTAQLPIVRALVTTGRHHLDRPGAHPVTQYCSVRRTNGIGGAHAKDGRR